jgi:hypothetical protein
MLPSCEGDVKPEATKTHTIDSESNIFMTGVFLLKGIKMAQIHHVQLM